MTINKQVGGCWQPIRWSHDKWKGLANPIMVILFCKNIKGRKNRENIYNEALIMDFTRFCMIAKQQQNIFAAGVLIEWAWWLGVDVGAN